MKIFLGWKQHEADKDGNIYIQGEKKQLELHLPKESLQDPR